MNHTIELVQFVYILFQIPLINELILTYYYVMILYWVPPGFGIKHRPKYNIFSMA